jgi:hypothetical protein
MENAAHELKTKNISLDIKRSQDFGDSPSDIGDAFIRFRPTKLKWLKRKAWRKRDLIKPWFCNL